MTIHHRHTKLFCSIFIALTCGLVAHAQSVTGRISGTVKDVSNAVIPGATVTVPNEATQLARAATTDEAASTSSPICRPGTTPSSSNTPASKKS